MIIRDIRFMRSSVVLSKAALLVGLAHLDVDLYAGEPPAVDIPPVVALTNPPDGADFTFPSVVRLKATASDPDGVVVAVRFYEGGTNLLGTVTAPPYNLDLTNVLTPFRGYELTARATDDQGGTTTSEHISIVVSLDPVPPHVSIASPADGDLFFMGTPIEIASIVKNYDGSENPVQFFADGKPIGTNAPPYTLVVSNLTLWMHTLTATYIDNEGNIGRSPEVHITVTPFQFEHSVLTEQAWLADGRFHFVVTGLTAGRRLEVQAKSGSLWSSVATNAVSSNTFEFFDGPAVNASGRLYRAFQIYN